MRPVFGICPKCFSVQKENLFADGDRAICKCGESRLWIYYRHANLPPMTSQQIGQVVSLKIRKYKLAKRQLSLGLGGN